MHMCVSLQTLGGPLKCVSLSHVINYVCVTANTWCASEMCSPEMSSSLLKKMPSANSTHTLTRTHTYTHTKGRSVSLIVRPHSLTHTLSLSLSHHDAHPLSHTHSSSLSLSFTHTHTHPQHRLWAAQKQETAQLFQSSLSHTHETTRSRTRTCIPTDSSCDACTTRESGASLVVLDTSPRSATSRDVCVCRETGVCAERGVCVRISISLERLVCVERTCVCVERTCVRASLSWSGGCICLARVQRDVCGCRERDSCVRTERGVCTSVSWLVRADTDLFCTDLSCRDLSWLVKPCACASLSACVNLCACVRVYSW